LLVPLSLPKFVLSLLQWVTNFGSGGTSPGFILESAEASGQGRPRRGIELRFISKGASP